MIRWSLIDVDSGRACGEMTCETYGEAVEALFPAKCCAGDMAGLGMNAVWLNAMTGPTHRREPICDGGHRYLLVLAGQEYLVDRLRRYARMYEGCADDLDDAANSTPDCLWAMRAFDEIAVAYLTDADDLERIEADEMEGLPQR